MKSRKNSTVAKIMAVCAMFIATLAVVNAQVLQKAPVNPAFIQYQQEQAQKAVGAKTFTANARGDIPPPVDMSYLKGRAPAGSRAFLAALPSSYDMRTQGRLTPIKNQNPYGTCWAFASYGSLESALMPAEERYFSVNSMANNHGFDYGYNSGGTYIMATAYLARWSGPINESDDPYSNGPSNSPAGLTVQKHVQEVYFLPAKASALDNTALKQAVVSCGGVYVSMWSDFDTNLYFNSTNSAFYYNGTSNTDHAVVIVGWDDGYSAANFLQAPAGNGAFIVRNSWGTNWGDHGYFYCSYYDSKMGSQASAAFNNAEPVTNYGSIYQYDPLGRVSDYGYSSTNAWCANIFRATNSEPLRAVGFYANDIDVNYTIYVYANATAGNPASGTLALTQSGACAYPGYHTFVLNSPVTLSPGQLFSVVIKLSDSSYIYPVAFEYALAGYSSRAAASPGQSYVSADGTSWSDLTTYDATANVCLKAYCGLGGGSVPAASTAGDVDGDQLADLISVSSSGDWYVWFSTAQYLTRSGPFALGVAGTPLTGDIDGDRLADLIEVVGSNWYVWFSTAQYNVRSGPFDMGVSGTPVTGDVDGDRLADLMVVSASGGWYVWFSTAQYNVRSGPFDLGVAGTPATGDLDGDRLADLISVVGSNWYVWFSTAQYNVRSGPFDLGVSGVPVTGDVDGDRLADLFSVVGSNWYVWFSTAQYLTRGGPFTMSLP